VNNSPNSVLKEIKAQEEKSKGIDRSHRLWEKNLKLKINSIYNLLKIIPNYPITFYKTVQHL